MKPTPRTYASSAYFLIAVVALTVSLMFRFQLKNIKDLDDYTQEVRRNLELEMLKVDGILNTLSHKAQNPEVPLTFSALEGKYEYPTFVFHDKKLVFWSSNHFSLPPELVLKNTQSTQSLDLRNGIFILRKVRSRRAGKQVDIAVLLPIETRYDVHNSYIQEGPNPVLFPDDAVEVSNTKASKYQVVTARDGFLFAIKFPTDYEYGTYQETVVMFFFLLAALFFILQIRRMVRALVSRGYYFQGFFLLAFFVGLLRGLMLYYGIPQKLTSDLPLFQPQYFASSAISPSLGDLFLNALSVFIVVGYIFRRIDNFLEDTKWKSRAMWKRLSFATLLVVLSYFMMSYPFMLMQTIYQNSKISLDITKTLSFSTLSITAYGVILLTAFSYFFVTHTLLRVLEALGLSIKRLFIILLSGSIFFLGIAFFVSFTSWPVVVLHLLYVSVLLFYRLPNALDMPGYRTVVYVLFFAVVVATVGAYAILLAEQQRQSTAKAYLSDELLKENDQVAEFMLAEKIQEIPEDQVIQQRLLSIFGPKDLIVKKITKYYLDNYLDRYEKKVYIFNNNGEPYNNTLHYDSLAQRYAQPEYATEYPNVYFIADYNSNSRSYYCFIEVMRKDFKVGKIVLELNLKKFIQNSIYPELLLDQPMRQSNWEIGKYSHAIFADDELLFSYGEFNYDRDFIKNFNVQNEKSLLTKDGYEHLFVKKTGQHRRVAVISSEVYPYTAVLSNASFFFLLLMLSGALGLAVNQYYYRQRPLQLNFAAKIQAYINLAFIIPLLFVSILIISALNQNKKEENKRNYFQIAESVGQNLADELESYIADEYGSDNLMDAVMQVASLTQTEINLYDQHGTLMASSQPSIYETGLLSKQVNPDVMKSLLEQQKSKLLLAEQVGLLSYSSAYMAVKSSKTGATIGMIGLPFFEAQSQADADIRRIVALILNVFTISLVTLFVLAYFASRLLTNPLQLITAKIQSTSLGARNEPLVYRSKDEIGLLVSEYNKMLVNLEESKRALSQSEKESAWREMAKQVAHEIKNPLTPMKLTLQHLQRIASREQAPLARPVETLLAQIDTLSDIATSFSAFAKMPIPKEEKMDITKVVLETLALYESSDDMRLVQEVDNRQPLYVKADRKLFGRILTNLILNGKQAVPEDRTATLRVSIQQPTAGIVRVTVTDNGNGIPPDIQKKIFMPSFTTKSTGSGIGLAVAKRGIEHAGGRIWFETQEGMGTTFVIELPLLPALV